MVFDGQSLNNSSPPGTYPAKVMEGRSEPWSVAALNGTSFTSLATTAPARLHRLPKPYARSVLVLNGGQTDLVDEDNTAAQAMTDLEAYVTAARAAGFDKVVVLTLTPATAFFATGDNNAQRLALNDLIRSSSAFDAVVDLDLVPELMDPADTTYYYDGLHFTGAGNELVAAALAPVLDELL